ncbi:MAG: magnesium-translocating P-type ATPase [Pseudomonadota bacterium]
MDAKPLPWWQDPVQLQAWRLPERAQGLSAAQARERLAQLGPNRFGQLPHTPAWRQYLRHLRNPLVLTLLAASAVSALSGEVTNFAIIAGIVLMSISLDFWQEQRAGRVVERLRQSVSVRATVLRDGRSEEHPVADLVPGDVVLLAAGDLVPADGLVLQARDFFVNQSVLTGESYPVEKHASASGAGEAWQDATHVVFMGASVVSGMARVVLVRTGAGTAMGEIADSLAQAPAPTAFEQGMRRFGMLILRLTFLLVLFVLLVNGLMGRPLLESFLFAVALAVGLTPELLPMVVSVTLSRGAVRMARQGIVVKRPSAIQDLGAMDVLCTDKTGTLTEARIRMERHVDPLGQTSERALELAWLNSHFETGLRSPLDEAILAHRTLDASAWTKVDEVPFDFERRRVSVLLERAGERSLVVKGAPDDILRLCTHCETAQGGAQRLDPAAQAVVGQTCHALEDEGFRVLAIAWRPVASDHPHAVVDDESQLVLAGFAAFLDPPKASAAGALTALQQAGVAIKVVTGDSERVTRHVAQALGLPVQGVLTGADIAQLNDEALRAQVETVNLFCRVNPTQKNRVIQAVRARGHVVGYMGDGVNDAPSLHSADVGLSVDAAVDVAKAAADMVLLQPDLRILQDAVLEGRRTFGNIRKYMLMGTSSNFGNMFSMAGAVLFLPFLPMLPAQILLNNILYDLSEISIPFDAVDAQDTAQAQAMDMGLIQRFMFSIGPLSSVFDFITFAVLLKVFDAQEALFQTGWFVESLCTQVLVIFVIRTRGLPWASRPHPMLVATSLGVVAVALALPFTPLAPLFGFVPLPTGFYLALALMVLAYLALVEWGKRRVLR